MGIESRWREIVRVVKIGPKAHSPPFKMSTRPSRVLKRTRRGARQPPPSSTGLKIFSIYTANAHLCLHMQVMD